MGRRLGEEGRGREHVRQVGGGVGDAVNVEEERACPRALALLTIRALRACGASRQSDALGLVFLAVICAGLNNIGRLVPPAAIGDTIHDQSGEIHEMMRVTWRKTKFNEQEHLPGILRVSNSLCASNFTPGLRSMPGTYLHITGMLVVCVDQREFKNQIITMNNRKP